MNVINQPVLVFAHPEEIILFLNIFRFFQMLRTFAINQFFSRVKPLASDAIITAVFMFVDFTFVPKILKNILDGFFVIIIGSTNKEIIGDFKLFPGFLKMNHHTIAVIFWFNTRF